MVSEGGRAAPMRSRRARPPGWLAGLERETLRTGALVVLAVVISVAALHEARSFAVPTVLAGLLAIALAPLSRRLERLRIPSSVAAAVLVVGALAASGATLYALAPSAEAWNARAPQMIRDIERKARQINKEVAKSVGGDAKRGSAASSGAQDDAVGQLVESGQRLATDFALSAPVIVGGAIYGAFLTFFLLLERGSLARVLLSLGAKHRSRLALGRAMRDVQLNVSRYLLAITIINIALGLATAGAFWLLGVPSPALWGVAMTLLNFMPYIGPLIMNVVVFVVGLVSFPEPVMAIWPVLALLALNTIEGQLITPMMVGNQMRLSALSIFIAIAFGAWLWGAAGALIATPTLIVVSAFAARMNSVAAHRPGRRGLPVAQIVAGRADKPASGGPKPPEPVVALGAESAAR